MPTQAKIEVVEARIPRTIVRPQMHEGLRLWGLPEHDSYSYAVAQIYMDAKNRSTLRRNYERALRA